MEMALQKIVGIIAGKVSDSLDMSCMRSRIDGVIRHNFFRLYRSFYFDDGLLQY